MGYQDIIDIARQHTSKDRTEGLAWWKGWAKEAAAGVLPTAHRYTKAVQRQQAATWRISEGQTQHHEMATG